MRKIIILMLATGLVFISSSCSSAETNKNDTNKTTEKNVCDVDCDTADMNDYETMKEENHVFKEISFSQSNELLKNKDFTGIIYYGYPTCAWCIEAVPIMNTVAKKMNLTIYYVNKKSQDSIDHPKEEEKAIQILDAAYGLDVDEKTKQPRLYVPEVVVIKKGKLISHNMGTVSGHNAKERKMTEDEILILNTIYENMFIEISE